MNCRKCKKLISDDALFCSFCGTKQQKQKKSTCRPNGTGSAIKRGNTWTAKVTLGMDENGNQIRRTKGGFATKTDALNYCPILMHLEPTENKKKTLSKYWKHFSEHQLQQMSKDKISHYKTAYERIADIAYIDIKNIDLAMVQAIIDERETYYPAKDVKTLLSRLFELAAAEGVDKMPLIKCVTLPPLNESIPEPFTEDEINKIWKAFAAGDNVCGYVLLMMYTGMMPGELCQLELSMIDLGAHTITGCGLKTKKRRTTPIVLCDEIIPVLEHLMSLVPPERQLLLPYRRDIFYEEYHKSITAAGCRDLNPYSCRHTTATALDNLKISATVIKEVMRHSNIQTTMRYIHQSTDNMLAAVNELHSTAN